LLAHPTSAVPIKLGTADAATPERVATAAVTFASGPAFPSS